MSSNRIRRIATRWHVEDSAPTFLPATVTAAVRARLDAVSPDARCLVDIVAIVESRASLRLLAHVSGVSAIAVADAIDLLCSGRILVEHGDRRISRDFGAHREHTSVEHLREAGSRLSRRAGGRCSRASYAWRCVRRSPVMYPVRRSVLATGRRTVDTARCCNERTQRNAISDGVSARLRPYRALMARAAAAARML